MPFAVPFANMPVYIGTAKIAKIYTFLGPLHIVFVHLPSSSMQLIGQDSSWVIFSNPVHVASGRFMIDLPSTTNI